MKTLADGTIEVYETYEQVEGMSNCRKKPISIQCKKMDTAFNVESLEGNYARGKPGDYLMKGAGGELSICDRAIFEKSYTIILD